MIPALVAAERNIRTVMGKMRKFVAGTTEYFTMKNYAKLFLISIIGILMLALTACNKYHTNPEIKVFSYLEPVINPPDTFQIAYNIRTYGDKIAKVFFKENAVWLVEKLGADKVILKALSDSSTLFINNKDTLAMKGSKQYIFIVNNNNYTNFTNYFIQFTKLPLSYNSFKPKFK